MVNNLCGTWYLNLAYVLLISKTNIAVINGRQGVQWGLLPSQSAWDSGLSILEIVRVSWTLLVTIWY